MRGKESERDRQTDTECLNTSDREKEKKIEREMVIVLLRHFKQTLRRLYILPPTGHHSTPEQTQLIFQSITVSQPVRR